jgi:hypothetical protein
VLSNQRWTFFTIGNIYSDLMKEKQRLINNYYYVHRKIVTYFVRTYEQYIRRHAKIQNTIM